MSPRMVEPEKKESFTDKLVNLIHRRQIVIWAVLIGVLVTIVIYFIWVDHKKKLTEASAILAEESQDLYSQWVNEKDEKKKSALEDKLLEKLKLIIREYPNEYGTQRALFIRANFYFDKKNWEKAALDFTDLSRSFPKSYLATISLFNAASCYEEMNKPEKAIVLYQDILKKYKSSIVYNRSLFALGRLNEQLEKYDEAKKYYERLQDESPQSNWTKLAINRIIYLKVNNKIKE